MSFNPQSGLPTSPRATRPPHTLLSPLDTTFASANSSRTLVPSYFDEKSSPASSMDIFANATIPLSPASSVTSSLHKELPYEGLAPRKRSGFARLFCCFGREERARRKYIAQTEFVKVGEDVHWSEL